MKLNHNKISCIKLVHLLYFITTNSFVLELLYTDGQTDGKAKLIGASFVILFTGRDVLAEYYDQKM